MNKHLTITLTPSSVYYQVLSGDSIINEAIQHFESDELSKDQLSDFHNAVDFLSNSFDEVSLAYVGTDSTIVPGFVFNESSAEDIYSLCFSNTVDKGNIDYNRISEENIVNVYSIPLWVKSFYIQKYPRIIIQHAGSHLLKSTLNANAFNLKVNLNVFNKSFVFIITKHNKIEYYSMFDYLAAEDIIYHLTFTLNQKEFIGEKGLIEFSNLTESMKSEEFTGLLSKIKDLDTFKVEESKDYIAKSQRLCV